MVNHCLFDNNDSNKILLARKEMKKTFCLYSCLNIPTRGEVDEYCSRCVQYPVHWGAHLKRYPASCDGEVHPGLCSFEEEIPDFWSRDPEEAMRHEREVVRDFTPMVIMDLIQLTATHEKIICENDIDIDSIIQLVTHAVVISNDKTWEGFVDKYENEIRTRDISEDEKENLIRKVNVVWGKGKPENPRGTNLYGVKQIFLDKNTTVEGTADIVAAYFGLPRT